MSHTFLPPMNSSSWSANSGRFTDEPVAEIVQCGEPIFSAGCDEHWWRTPNAPPGSSRRQNSSNSLRNRSPNPGVALGRAGLAVSPRHDNQFAATSLSTASALCSGAKCAYRSVIDILRWPSNSRIVLRSTPAITSLLAKVWRRSWKRNEAIRAVFSTPRHAFRASVNGVVVVLPLKTNEPGSTSVLFHVLKTLAISESAEHDVSDPFSPLHRAP